MKIQRIILTILYSFQLSSAKSQEEFFVKVNPNTGVHTIIDSLPGVNYILGGCSAYDKNNKRYIFKGQDFNGQYHLYCVDAITGSITSAPACTLNVGEFQYDNSGNTLFAVELNNALGVMYLVSLDITTAISTIKGTFPFMGVTNGTTCFNEINGNYIIRNAGSLYSMSATTGSVTSSSVSTSLNEICFDNTTGFAYALSIGSPMTLAKIIPATGASTTVCTFTFSNVNSVQTSFNEINQIYTFGSSNHLFSVAVNTGSIVSSPVFPVGITSPQNVIELHYDNLNGSLNALHWGPLIATGIDKITNSEKNDFKIMPNPATSNSAVYLGREIQKIDISISDIFGRVITKQTEWNAAFINLRLDRLSKGIYFISVVADYQYLGMKKIIFE